jgi:hypothetical protein
VHINCLEFIGIVLGVCVLVCHLPTHTRVHIHAWSDNTCAVSDAERRRARDPLALSLLTVIFILQMSRPFLLTHGHVPGEQNEVADGISRHLQGIPEDVRSRVSRTLESIPSLSVPAWLLNIILNSFSQFDLAVSQLIRNTLTEMVQGTGSGFLLE